MSKEIIIHDIWLDAVSEITYEDRLIVSIKDHLMDILWNIDDSLAQHEHFFKSEYLKDHIQYLDIWADAEVWLFEVEWEKYIIKRYWKKHKYSSNKVISVKDIKYYYHIHAMFRQLLSDSKEVTIIDDPYIFLEKNESYRVVMPYVEWECLIDMEDTDARKDTIDHIRSEISNVVSCGWVPKEVVYLNVKVDDTNCVTDMAWSLLQLLKKSKSRFLYTILKRKIARR